MSSELEHLLELNCEERYDYFLDAVIEEKEIWIVVNNNNEFLKIFAEEEGFEYLPAWPSEELARHYSARDSELQTKSISLPEFLKKWVPGLKQDELEIGVFPGSDGTVWLTSSEELKADLQDALSNQY